MAARMSKPHFWHEIAITLVGPISMTFFSLGLAHILEEGEGPVLPPLHGPDTSQRTRSGAECGSLPNVKGSSSSFARREEQGCGGDDGINCESDSHRAMRLIFAFS
jgi:hypothetical protein